jgi:hypothetical protein
MNPLTIINVIANAIVAGAVVSLALKVFGRPDHPIHGNRVMVFSRKFVSSVVICGAVLNIITLSTPSWTEVLLNVGFSLNYLWSNYYYDRNANTANAEVSAEIPKRSSSSRSSGARKTSSRSTSGRKRGQRSAT